MTSRHSTGINFALTTALISGVSIFVNKFAVTTVGQPLVFTAVKNTGVALLILAILATGSKWQQVKSLTRRQLLQLLFIGVIGGSLPFYLFFTGLSAIPAINGAIIHKTLVIWVALLAVPFLKERLSVRGLAAVILLFAANISVGGFSGLKFSLGELFVLLATLLWAVETVLAKKLLARVDPDIVTAARMGLGAVILLSLSQITNHQSLITVLSFNLTQWAWVGLTTVLLLAYVTTWYRALKFTPATTVTAVLVASTLVTNVLSAIFITHSFNSQLLFQSLLIVIGIKAIYQAKIFRPQLSALPRSNTPD